jgi:CBS domain-containing protein
VVFDKRTVGNLMQTRPITVEPGVTLSAFVNQIVLRHGLSFVPVVEGGTLLGHIDHAMLTSIDRENWSSTQVGDIFAGLDEGTFVSPDTPVEDLVRTITSTGRRKFLVVQDSKLVGVISMSDLLRHLQLSDLVPAA